MKINGKPVVEKNHTHVSIDKGGETLTLKLTPLPMNWRQKIFENGYLTQPVPPKKIVEDAQGRKVKSAGGKWEMEEDRNDPEYRQQMAQFMRRFNALELAEYLREDDTVEFETIKPVSDDPQEWREYADGLIKELEESSFTDEEIEMIMTEADNVSLKVNEDAAKSEFTTPTNPVLKGKNQA